MIKFIELRDDENKLYFNINNICCFFRREESGETEIFTNDTDDMPFTVKETPTEIMAKIQEAQG